MTTVVIRNGEVWTDTKGTAMFDYTSMSKKEVFAIMDEAAKANSVCAKTIELMKKSQFFDSKAMETSFAKGKVIDLRGKGLSIKMDKNNEWEDVKYVAFAGSLRNVFYLEEHIRNQCANAQSIAEGLDNIEEVLEDAESTFVEELNWYAKRMGIKLESHIAGLAGATEVAFVTETGKVKVFVRETIHSGNMYTSMEYDKDDIVFLGEGVFYLNTVEQLHRAYDERDLKAIYGTWSGMVQEDPGNVIRKIADEFTMTNKEVIHLN